VRRHERQDRTIVGAFADWTGQQLRERAPDIPRIFSAKESLLIYLKYFTGASPSCIASLSCTMRPCIAVWGVITHYRLRFHIWV
jgi:hypothetical protein